MTAQLERVKSDAATTLKTASDNHEATLQTLRAQSDDLRNKFNAEKQRADGLQTLNATQKTSLSTADAQIKNLTAELAAEADKVSKNAASIVQLKEQLKVADEKIKKLTTDIAEVIPRFSVFVTFFKGNELQGVRDVRLS